VNAAGLQALLATALLGLEQSRDELRALDAAIGDGDLGITVASGAQAAREALSTQQATTPAEVLRTVARAFAKANPSTMSALVATGLLAAARELGVRDEVDRAAAVGVVRHAATAIAARGGAESGDKTVLDAILPSADALEAAGPDNLAALRDMVNAARNGVESTTALRSQRGRAAWVGARSEGHADGGATAYLRLLENLERSWKLSDV
jgi:phosphoenolpyruvate---glycerone phosphotransferase subunit DhaL